MRAFQILLPSLFCWLVADWDDPTRRVVSLRLGSGKAVVWIWLSLRFKVIFYLFDLKSLSTVRGHFAFSLHCHNSTWQMARMWALKSFSCCFASLPKQRTYCLHSCNTGLKHNLQSRIGSYSWQCSCFQKVEMGTWWITQQWAPKFFLWQTSLVLSRACTRPDMK